MEEIIIGEETKQMLLDILGKVVTEAHISSLARKTGLSRALLYQILKGHSNITIATFAKIIEGAGYKLEINLINIDAVEEIK